MQVAMAQISVILNYNCSTGQYEPANIFARQPTWNISRLTEVFYGNVAIMSVHMAEAGAIPGILALCPTVVPIQGNWLFKSVVRRLAESDSDLKTAVFPDETNYRSVVDSDRLDRLFIAMNCTAAECPGKLPEYRGWEMDGSTELEPDFQLVEMKRCKAKDLDDSELDAEISRMEMEMNEPSDSELVPESKRELDRLIATILTTWEVFGKYDYDMPQFLANTENVSSTGEVYGEVGYGDPGSMGVESGVDDELRGQMTGPNQEAMEAYASLRVVQVMANTVRRLSDFAVKTHGIAVENVRGIQGLQEKLSDIDAMAAEAIRSMDEKCDAVRDLNAEEISGLRHQVALLAMKSRARNYVPAVCAAITTVCLVLSLIF